MLLQNQRGQIQHWVRTHVLHLSPTPAIYNTKTLDANSSLALCQPCWYQTAFASVSSGSLVLKQVETHLHPNCLWHLGHLVNKSRAGASQGLFTSMQDTYAPSNVHNGAGERRCTRACGKGPHVWGASEQLPNCTRIPGRRSCFLETSLQQANTTDFRKPFQL